MDVVAGNLTAVIALVKSGYNLTGGGNWQGPGITSSAAAGDTTHLTALAVVQNNQSGTPRCSTAPATSMTSSPGPPTCWSSTPMSGTPISMEKWMVPTIRRSTAVTSRAAAR